MMIVIKEGIMNVIMDVMIGVIIVGDVNITCIQVDVQILTSTFSNYSI